MDLLKTILDGVLNLDMEAIGIAVGLVIAGCAMAARGLHELAKMTKTEKDDNLVALISAGLEWLAQKVKKIGIHTPEKK